MTKVITDIFKGNFFKGDKGIWMIFFFLCLFSLVEGYSASSNLTFNGGNHWDPMISQFVFIFLGFLVVFLVHLIPYRYFMLLPVPLLLAAIILLIYATFFGETINGANRWIRFYGISVQPSEIAKAALVTFTAMVLAKTQTEVKEKDAKGRIKVKVGALKGGHSWAFSIIMGVTCFLCLFIFFENFSTAALLFATIFMMMWIGRIPLDLLGKTILACLALIALLVTVIMIVPEDTLGKIPKMGRAVTWKHRIEAMTGANRDDGKEYNFKDDLQASHAQIAIASSNGIGRGPGNSVERDFLPHAESDFIYSIIVEETGILGAVFVLFLYVALIIRASRIAKKCQRYFPVYLVLGLAMLITFQALTNMLVATGLFVTGQPLPIISRGGSSLFINCGYIGMILSVSRNAESMNLKKKENSDLLTAHTTPEFYNQENID